MTAMNWFLQPKQLLLFCDTLGTSGEDHLPYSLVTKVFVAGHLNAVICGTGFAQVVSEFYGRVVGGFVVRDVGHLNEFAPPIIAAIYDRLVESLAISHDKPPSVTVYTFGWIQEEGQFGGFAYRSTNAFAPERLGYGTCMKPPTSDAGIVDKLVSIDGFIELMRIQQSEDRSKAREDRVGIGGDVLLYSMSADEVGGVLLQVKKVAQLEFFSNDWDVILAKLPQNINDPLSKQILELAP